MNQQYIWIKNKKYYYYETYSTWKQAKKTANRYKKKNKCRYFIQYYDDGSIINNEHYNLYLNKVIKLWQTDK